MIARDILPDGAVRLSDGACSFTFTRLRLEALLVRVEGYDQGQFGAAALDEMGAALRGGATLEIFVDARAAAGVTTAVREEWTRWFTANQGRLKRVHVLVLGRFMQQVVSVSQHLARVGALMQIYGDEEKFEQALGKVILGG